MSKLNRLVGGTIVAVALSIATLAPGSAQLEPQHLPMDLALALLGGQGPETRIFVDGLPSGIEGVIPLGSVSRVVGGLARGPGGTVVVEVSGTAREALTAYQAHLRSEGWTRPAPHDDRGGFQGTFVGRQPWWCGTDYAIRGSTTGLDTGTYLIVHYAPRSQGRSVCDALMRERSPDPYVALALPALEAPPETRVVSRGSGVSLDGVWDEASIESEVGVELLFEHYAQQLGAAGWSLQDRALSSEVAIGRWDARDADGEPVVGSLTLWRGAAPGSYSAALRLDRARETGGR